MVTHNVFFAKHLLALAKICTRISQCPGNVYQKAVRKTLQRFTGKCRRWNPSLFKSQLNNFSLQYEKTSSKIHPNQFSGHHQLTDVLNLQSIDKKLFIYFQLIHVYKCRKDHNICDNYLPATEYSLFVNHSKTYLSQNLQ